MVNVTTFLYSNIASVTTTVITIATVKMGFRESYTFVVVLVSFFKGGWRKTFYHGIEFEDEEHYLEDKGRQEKRCLYKYCKDNFTRVRTYEEAMKGATTNPENTFINGCPLRNGKHGPAVHIFISDTYRNSGDTYYPIHFIQNTDTYDNIHDGIFKNQKITLPKPGKKFSVFAEVEDNE